jgi:hypothetical protein
MLSELCNAARRRREPIGRMPLFINAFSPFLEVTVAGSKIGAERVIVSVAASLFHREVLEKGRIGLVECDDI